jgi:hypothetical protein
MYSMIYCTLQLPDQTGSFQDICDVIEEDFNAVLNWKLESDVRRTPVWKSSVSSHMTEHYVTIIISTNMHRLLHCNVSSVHMLACDRCCADSGSLLFVLL